MNSSKKNWYYISLTNVIVQYTPDLPPVAALYYALLAELSALFTFKSFVYIQNQGKSLIV